MESNTLYLFFTLSTALLRGHWRMKSCTELMSVTPWAWGERSGERVWGCVSGYCRDQHYPLWFIQCWLFFIPGLHFERRPDAGSLPERAFPISVNTAYIQQDPQISLLLVNKTHWLLGSPPLRPLGVQLESSVGRPSDSFGLVSRANLGSAQRNHVLVRRRS